MEQAVHQTLINDIETLLANPRGIDEVVAKTYRKTAEDLIAEQAAHPLKESLSTCLEQLRERVHRQVEKRDADYEKVVAELNLASTALKQEKLKAAEEATHKALSIAGQIPGLSAQRRAEMEKLLDHIYPHMRKLSAWRHWGTTQARENLIAQIRQIHGSDMDPNKIVKTLREAKAQWQDWEKSGDHSEHRLWKEFSDACDTAYEPCRVYFKQQKQERKKNLALKRELIEKINARFETTDWSRPDWKAIDKWLRQARGRFFKIGQTDYKQHKKLKTRLDTAVGQFEEYLSRERTRSLKFRRKLIEDIGALDQLDDIHEAMSQLETLRKQWVVTVLDKRGVENKLWDEFQKAQKQIYDKRNADRIQQDQQRNQNLKLKRQVVESLIRAAHAPEETLIAAPAVLAQHKDQFNDIGYVPRKAEKSLMDSWRAAQKEFSAALNKAQKNRARHSRNALIDKARFCAALEQRKLQGKSPDVEKSREEYDTMPVLSNDQESLLRARMEAALKQQGYPETLLAENTETQLMRCLKAEVMLDLPSPDRFSKQRMAFQIERLSASMKKHTQAQESIEALSQDLLTTGPVDVSQFDAIWARMDAILRC